MTKKLTEAEFNKKQHAVIAGCAANLVEFNIPNEAYDPLLPLQEQYEEKYVLGCNAAKQTRSKIDVANLVIAHKALKKPFNIFVRSYVKYNIKISNDLKNKWNVHIDSDSRTKTGLPQSFPRRTKVDLNTPSHVIIGFKDSGKSSAAERGVVQAWIFIVNVDKDGHDILPASDEDYKYVCDGKEQKVKVKCKLKDGGKEMMVKLCYKNHVGQGEFGPVITATIPR